MERNMLKKYELSPSDLRSVCEPKTFNFKDTSELDPLDEVIGQTRAVEAIDFGLNMKSPGYNIFVTGLKVPENPPLSGTSSVGMQKPSRRQLTGAWCIILRMNTVQKRFLFPPGERFNFQKKWVR